MRPLNRIPGYRAALVAALLASACQHDSTADFDDSHLPSSGNGAASDSGGTQEPDAGGAAEEGGSSAQTGGASRGGKPGAAGSNGGAGKPAMAGKGGQETGGSGPGGSAGASGSAGAAQAGSGGKPNPVPDPVTVDITQFEDTTIASCDPNQDFSSEPTLQTDGDFCRFESLLKPSLASLPASAQVSKATLDLFCVNPGGQVYVSYITEAWKDSTVHFNTRPNASAPFDHFTCAQDGDVISIDLTEGVSAWLAGKREAYGIYLTTETTDGTDFASSEAQKSSERPVLTVTYVLPLK